MGFYYSHDGYWSKGYDVKGSKTKIECANTCLQDCVAFNSYAATGASACYHYSDRSLLISANVRTGSNGKAYIKCLGNDM